MIGEPTPDHLVAGAVHVPVLDRFPLHVAMAGAGQHGAEHPLTPGFLPPPTRKDLS